MSVVLTVFIILASLLMIGIVLVQKSKGGGLASNFASSNQIMGVRKTTDFVEKATWTLAIVIMVLSIATVFVSHNGQQSSVSEIKDIVNTEAPAALPGFETPATGNNAAPAQEALVRNGIFFDFEKRKAAPVQSKFGGKPALQKKFEWPHYTDEYGEHIVLPFFLQLSCEELSVYDTDNLLPHEGMFYLFYDLTNQPWRNSKGAKLLYTPTPISELVPADFPDNLPEEHRLPEMALKFTAHTCAPDWEDYVGMTGDDNTAYTDWDIIERKLGKWGYPHMESAGRILGYASLIQNGIAEACESRAQEEKQQTYSKKSAREWILLLQLNCIEEEEVDIPFGDCGSLYFYIRQQDLERRDFSQIQFELQCY